MTSLSLRAILALGALVVLARSAAFAAPPTTAIPGFNAFGTGQRVVYLIGLLSEQAVPVCSGGNDYSWADSHYEVGFVRLSPGASAPPGLLGRPVLVKGRHDPLFSPKAPAATGPCPLPAQMRSDWVVSGDGSFRVQRELPATVTAASPFSAGEIVPFEGLKLERRGQELQVRFVNTLDRRLEGFALRAHYEGCSGKPASHAITRSFSSLAPGDLAQSTFAGTLHLPEDPKGRHDYALSSVQVLSASAEVLFDYDQPLRAPELRFSCKD